MEQSTVQRKLVTSAPELWAQVSSEGARGRHLAPFGAIRITLTQPGTTVAWEGDRASGTVELGPAGWGTKVMLTATRAPASAPLAPQREPVPPPVLSTPPPHEEPVIPPTATEPQLGVFARLVRRRAPQLVLAARAPAPPELSPPAPGPEPTPPDPDPAPTLVTRDSASAEAILAGVLDDLGAAHHRPFSRD